MYNHKEIEDYYIKKWEKDKIYKTGDGEKFYTLSMFPYPSGSGLHIGHARIYIGSDIYSRKKRMEGYSVLNPMGWDAFGLPAEEYAIKNKEHPRISTQKNISNFKEQCKRLALSYDWDREINTTDPMYYKWTQWMFIKMFEKGLVYEAVKSVNWCPSCKTGLANEDLDMGKCERCNSYVEKKPLKQWFIKITDYAERLLNDLDLLNGWSDYTKEVQKNWIGKSVGYEFKFETSKNFCLNVFTTRLDTIFGCTFVAVSPQSEIMEKLLLLIDNKKEVEEYIASCIKEYDEEQTGILLSGVHAIHPITNEKIPLFVANYVLSQYGSGVVFGVPAHDKRDFDFANKYNLKIKQVIDAKGKLPIIENGILINSGEFNGLDNIEAKKSIAKKICAIEKVNYKLQDWLFSRQRYWGEPIPLIRCKFCGVVTVSEKDLPVELPDIKNYTPTGTGESPLAKISEWVNVKCPKCMKPAKRETNTMPQWAGSSWYHLRYIDNKNDNVCVDSKLEKKWMSVDMYTGGMEHAARHLIYARFWHKFLFDINVVHDHEPYTNLRTVGIVQAEGGGKMSKRLGNIVNPIEIAEHVGVDALRVYIAQIAPFAQTVLWDKKAIAGARRFLERVYMMKDRLTDEKPSKSLEKEQNKAIHDVLNDIEEYKFNTAVSSLMILSNNIGKIKSVPRETYIIMLKLLAPFAPYITEDLWSKIGEKGSIHIAKLPVYDKNLTKDELITIVIQVEGKKKGSILLPYDSGEIAVLEEIKKNDKLNCIITDKKVKVFVKNQIINFI